MWLSSIYVMSLNDWNMWKANTSLSLFNEIQHKLKVLIQLEI